MSVNLSQSGTPPHILYHTAPGASMAARQMSRKMYLSRVVLVGAGGDKTANRPRLDHLVLRWFIYIPTQNLALFYFEKLSYKCAYTHILIYVYCVFPYITNCIFYKFTNKSLSKHTFPIYSQNQSININI